MGINGGRVATETSVFSEKNIPVTDGSLYESDKSGLAWVRFHLPVHFRGNVSVCADDPDD